LSGFFQYAIPGSRNRKSCRPLIVFRSGAEISYSSISCQQSPPASSPMREVGRCWQPAHSGTLGIAASFTDLFWTQMRDHGPTVPLPCRIVPFGPASRSTRSSTRRSCGCSSPPTALCAAASARDAASARRVRIRLGRARYAPSAAGRSLPGGDRKSPQVQKSKVQIQTRSPDGMNHGDHGDHGDSERDHGGGSSPKGFPPCSP
jgi:hypothetical protein